MSQIRKYPILELKPGESFEVPTNKLSSVRNCIQSFKARRPEMKEWKFATRKQGLTSRIWRVK